MPARYRLLPIVLTLITFSLSHAQDTEPPSVSGTPTIEPANLDLSQGDQTVVVTLNGLDNDSGVLQVFLSFDNAQGSTGFSSGALDSGTPQNGVWRAESIVPARSLDGVYDLTITIIDVAGNRATPTFSDALTITGGDQTPPELIGVSSVSPDTLFIPDDVTFGDVDTVVVIVELADSGTGVWQAQAQLLNEQGIPLVVGLCDLMDGDERSGTWRCEARVFLVQFNAPDSPKRFSLSMFLRDKASNTATIETDFEVVFARGKSPVAFKVDMRRMERIGLFERGDFFDEGMDIYVDILNGPEAGQHELSNVFQDSVWSASVPVTPMAGLQYAFAIDPNSDGQNLGDWVYERPGNPRVVDIEGLGELAPVPFDDLPVGGEDLNFAARVTRNLPSGQSDPLVFDQDTAETLVTLSFGSVSTPALISVRRFTEDPGGAAPSGIASLSSGQRWIVDIVPSANTDLATVAIGFDGLGGITDPASLKLLRRDDPLGSWDNLTTTVDAGSSVAAAASTNPSGEFTLGSSNASNTLIPVLPGLATLPIPGDGDMSVDITTSLSWTPAPNARSHDLYLWREDFGEQPEPLARYLEQPNFIPLPFWIERGQTYVWYVESRNLDGTVVSPQWTFTTELEPDLAISDVVVPSEGFSGREIELQWTVTNVSEVPTNVPSWVDVIYFSDDPSFVQVFQPLARIKNASALGPGEEYLQTATVRLPDTASGPNYVQIIANGDGLQREEDFSNNDQVSAIEVSRSPLPDLAISEIVVPANAFSMGEIAIEWTVTNEGPGDASSEFGWNDILYLTDDPDAALGSATIATRLYRTDPLAAGDSYTMTETVVVPAQASGVWYIVAQTNDNSSVFEGGASENNIAASTPIQVTLSPPPDLMPNSVAGPSDAVAGEEISVDWTVTNRGPGPVVTSGWADRLYLVSDDGTDQPILLATVGARGPVEPDSSYAASVTTTLPDGLGGSYLIRVDSDWADAVFEHTFEDNNTADQAISIQRPPYPDLSVVSFDHAQSGEAGSEMLLQWSVMNEGDSSPVGSWVDRIYLSSRPAFDSTAFPLLTNPAQQALAPAASYSHSQRVRLPAEMDGDLFLHVVSDDDRSVFEFPDDTTNNVRTSAIEVAPYPPVDILMAQVSGPNQARAGDKVRVEWSVENSGDAAPPSPIWDDVVYLSADTDLDPASDAVLARVRRAEGLEPGSSYQRTATVDIPAIATGSLNLLVHAEIPDSDEANNFGVAANAIEISAAPAADLRVVSIDAPTSAIAGQPITMNVTVVNDGPELIDTDWTDAVYSSTDRTLQAGDFVLASRESTGPLGAGESYEFELEIQTLWYQSGSQFLLVVLDDGGSVFEGPNDGNNEQVHEISLTLAPPSDLVVSDVTVPESTMPGQETVIEWTLTNQGSNQASGWLRDAVYVSGDDTWQLTDPLVGIDERIIDLAPGASEVMTGKVDLSRTLELDAQGNVTASLPGVAPGGYFAIVRADIQNNIRETADDNNAAASIDSMVVDVEDLPLGGSVAGKLLPGQSRYYKIEVPAGIETIELELEASDDNSSNELFVRDGLVPTRTISDVSFTDPFASSFNLVAPTSFGHTTQYVLLFGRDGSAEGTDYTLSVSALQFELNAIDLERGGDGGDVTVRMTGAALSDRLRAYLENDQISIRADRVVQASTSDVYATFDLRGVPLGGYDVVLEKDESSLHLAADEEEIIRIDTAVSRSILPLGFTVEPNVSPEPVVETVTPEVVLVDSEFRVVLEVTNYGNVDMVSPLVFFMTNPATYANVEVGEGPTAGYKQILMTGEAPVAGTLRPGETSSVLVNVVAPLTSVYLRVYAGLARHSGQTFDIIAELDQALLNGTDQEWGPAIDELVRELDGAGWRAYERKLAQSASELSESDIIEQDGSRLLLNVIRNILQSQAAPEWADNSQSSSNLEALPKNYSVADPCAGIGSPADTPGLECGLAQLAADRLALGCVAAGLAAPGICGGTHGAAHLLHFLDGNGETIVYDDQSEIAAKMRSHPGQKSYEDIKQEVSGKIRDALRDQLRDLSCDNFSDFDGEFIPMQDLNIDVPKPKAYLDATCKAVPIYNPFKDGGSLPRPDQINFEQPGCDLVTAFGGFQSAEAYAWDIKVTAMRDPGAKRCDKPGCTIRWEGNLTFKFGDKYEFDENDRGEFDDRGRNLQLCGFATPFKTQIVMQEPISGLVRIPPERNECPKPPELPPFLFLPPAIIPVIASFDPNDIVGPAGTGDERWVSVSETLPYTIRFENDAELATAPAQVVSVEQILPDSTIDPRSFRLGAFGFGDLTFQPPTNAASYSERLDLSDSLGIILDVNAGLDVESNRVFWVLRTLDAATGRAPTDPFAGFLAVNDSLGSGEGFVSYTVRPNPTAKTGDVILATAEIVFDRNEPIETPEVFNTIDAGLPQSTVVDVPTRVDTTTFELTFEGRDDPGGSGVGLFDLYVSKDGGAFELHGEDLASSGLLFNAEQDHRYSFYTLTSDRSGNREPAASKVGRLVIVSTEEESEIPEEFSLGQNYPNPFNPSTTVPYALSENADVELEVFNALGQRVLRYKMDARRAGTHTLRVNLDPLASGVYFYRLEATNFGRVLFSDTRKMVLVK